MTRAGTKWYRKAVDPDSPPAGAWVRSRPVAGPGTAESEGGGRLRRQVAWALVAATVAVAGCASAPTGHRVVSEVPQTQMPPTQVFFYPSGGQSREQQDRDRYECYLWAVKQTGFDPSQPPAARQVRVEVVPVPAPGTDTAVGAVTGAIFGAAVSHHHDTAEGAIIGAIAGAMIGAASDAARQERAERVQARYDRRDVQAGAQLERQARDYRRAMAACLEGRGYSVY